MNHSSKLCAIIYDELAIIGNLTYDACQDCIEGLEGMGHAGTSQYVANHAGVSMVLGIVEKWK